MRAPPFAVPHEFTGLDHGIEQGEYLRPVEARSRPHALVRDGSLISQPEDDFAQREVIELEAGGKPIRLEAG